MKKPLTIGYGNPETRFASDTRCTVCGGYVDEEGICARHGYPANAITVPVPALAEQHQPRPDTAWP